MPARAKLHITLVVVLGWAAIVVSISGWHTQTWTGFLLYLCLSVLASSFKLSLPGITGTMSAAFFPVLIGIVCLTLPEALIGACASVLIQCIWHSRTKQLVKISFNVANVAIAVACSGVLYHSQWLRRFDLEFAVRLAILGCVYFVANTLPVAAIIGLTEGKPIGAVWRGSFFWSFPHYLVGAAMAGLFDLSKEHLGWQTALLLVPITCLIYRAGSLYLGRIEDARKNAEETAALHLRTITTLALAIEAKDQETHNHLRRVQVYAVEIGKELGLGQNELDALRAAALLHDIGKIAVPDRIIVKPGKLTPEEFLRMKVHPVVGAEILERVRFPFPVAPIVRCHHEKWDGSGYPAGLTGEEIPIGARILTTVDFLDALASDRPYRSALPLNEAMAAVARESGKLFDPRVVEVLQRRYTQLEEMIRNSFVEPFRLSTDIRIERGAAPDAGLVETGVQAEVSGPASAGEVSDLIRLQCLLEAVSSGDRFLNFQETLSIFGARLARAVPFESMAVYLKRGSTLVPAYTAGLHGPKLASLAIPVGLGVSGWAAEAGRPIVGNPATEWRYSSHSSQFAAPLSALAVPLPGDLMPAGILTLYASSENAFRTDHLRIVTGFAPQIGAYLKKESVEVAWDGGVRVAPTESWRQDAAASPVALGSVLIQ